MELVDKNARLQTEVHQVNCQAKFLKFTIGARSFTWHLLSAYSVLVYLYKPAASSSLACPPAK